MAIKPSPPHSLPTGAGAPHVVRWRAEHLRVAGFEPGLAERLAADAEMDVHAMLELVDRGCPPVLAARIVAPLDRDPDAA